MTTTNGAQSFSVRRPGRVVPFKHDFARRIDRVIDYFGAAQSHDHPRASRPRIRIGAAKARER
jgi:hypothetical protein